MSEQEVQRMTTADNFLNIVDIFGTGNLWHHPCSCKVSPGQSNHVFIFAVCTGVAMVNMRVSAVRRYSDSCDDFIPLDR